MRHRATVRGRRCGAVSRCKRLESSAGAFAGQDTLGALDVLSILVVAEHPTVQRVMRIALTKAGYSVVLASDQAAALEAIRKNQPDAVIFDLDVPPESGKSLCSAIQQACPDRKFPIFLVTSSMAQLNKEWAANLSDLYFLEKPLSVRVLTATLTESAGTETVIMKVGP